MLRCNLSRFLSVIMIPDVETPGGGNEGLLACDMCFKVFGSVSQSGDKMFNLLQGIDEEIWR